MNTAPNTASASCTTSPGSSSMNRATGTIFPTVYGPELYIWNIWTIAGGYQGFNMYLFASGVNRPGMGFFGTDHNWQAPIDYDGTPRASL